MWLIIILIVSGIIIKFLVDRNKVERNISKQGGVLQKYNTLINHLKGGNPDVKMLKITNNTVELGINNISGSTIFSVIHSFGKVEIRWDVNNIVLGKHGLRWSFNEFKDQNTIAEIIHNELGIYQENVLKSKNIT